MAQSARGHQLHVVTLVTLLLLIALIFILNYAFSKGIFWLFKT